MKKTYNLLIAMVLTFGCFYSNASSQTTASGEFSIQGRLTSSSGTAVTDGVHVLETKIYSKATGSVVFTQVDNVVTSDGMFSVLIGSNGTSGTTFEADSKTEYEIGISVDGGTELSPRLKLGSVVSALTADIAANAETVGGFGVSTSDSAAANTLLVLNGSGKVRTSLLDSSIVTSVNGASGNIQIQGGGDLNVSSQGNMINLSFNGSSGSLNFPFEKSLSLAVGSGFSIHNSLAGTSATFTNTGIGTAISAEAGTGAAIKASSNGTIVGDAAIEVHNAGGAAIDASANVAGDAVVIIKNESSSNSAKILTAVNAASSTVLEVAATGKTTVNSSVGNALEVTTSATGEAAMKLNGGLTLNGPVGTGTVAIGQTLATVTNAYAKANSIIIITVNDGGAAAVVSVFNGIGAVAGNVDFNYLIINQ
jgi:hypothetical protein